MASFQGAMEAEPTPYPPLPTRMTIAAATTDNSMIGLDDQTEKDQTNHQAANTTRKINRAN